jgi:hypothetical protein
MQAFTYLCLLAKNNNNGSLVKLRVKGAELYVEIEFV